MERLLGTREFERFQSEAHLLFRGRTVTQEWKFVVESYREFSRTELVDQRLYVEQTSPHHLVLGGEYADVAIQVNPYGARLICVTGDDEVWLPEKYFKPTEAMTPCPFNIGDRVRVRDDEVADNRKFLEWVFPALFDERTLVEINRVVNRYYVFLSLDSNALEFPFLHTSLEPRSVPKIKARDLLK